MVVKPWMTLVAIIALGLAVRLYGLTAYGVWFDEAYHIQLVQLPDIPTMLDAVLSNPPSDPLYALLLRAWTSMFGYGDLSVRLLSVLFGTATIPATYWLGQVMANRTVGLVAALLMALSPYAIEFSQQAAMYALASLTTTLALAAGWRWRQGGGGLLLYVILASIAIYSHYVVAVILGLFTLFLLFSLRESVTGQRPTNEFAAHAEAKSTYVDYPAPGQPGRRQWLGSNVAVFLLWSPWLFTMLVYWFTSQQARAGLPHAAHMEEVVGALVQYTSGTAALQQGQRALEALGLLSGGALLLAACLRVWRVKSYGVGLILVMSALVFFLPAIASAVTGRWLFVPHFMLFLLPALLVVLGVGAASELRIGVPASLRQWLLPALLGALLAAQVWGLVLFYRYPPHGADGLRELASVLREKARPGEMVFVTPPVLTPTLRQYYSGDLRGLPTDFNLKAVYLPYDAEEWYRQSVTAISTTGADRERFWLVYRPELDEGGQLLAHVTSNYRVVERRSYSYADLYLLEKP